MAEGDSLHGSVIGNVFIGTPHRGAPLLRLLRRTVHLLPGIHSSPMLRQLELNSETLRALHKSFRRVLRQTPMRTCSAYEYETRNTSGFRQFVSVLENYESRLLANEARDC